MSTQPELERVIPELVGISSNAIQRFLDSIQEKSINLHSFMLLRHGKVAAEGQYRPFGGSLLHPIFSISKTVTSAAIGIAIGEGLLTLEDRIVDFFPDKLDGELHPYTEMMTIRHLLMMATVHPKSTNTQVDDWVHSFLNTPPSHPPGTVFAYDTTGTHTLCAILQKVTGVTVHEYLRSRLFEPIGIGPMKWESCPLGINKGGGGIWWTTEDLARFGQLYLQQGVWQGRQVLPPGWVELSTSRQIDNSQTRFLLEGRNGYGFQIWRSRYNSYCFFGMGGQFVVVIPDHDAVFVSTANTLLHKDGHQMILDSFWETLYPALLDESLGQNTSEYERLKVRLDGLSLQLPDGDIRSPHQAAITGTRYGLEPNPLRLQACKFDLNEEASALKLYFHSDRPDGELHELRFGLRSWITDKEPLFGEMAAAAGTWVDDRTLVIHCQLLHHMQMYMLVCRLEEKHMVIQVVSIGTMESNDKLECFLNGIPN
jgi:CubicO group peptidase (beta-lactamase class C family)